MRIIWKDSHASGLFKPIKYRQFTIRGCGTSARGWIIDIPGDNNIYKNNYCAQNAIDAYYGDFGQRGGEKRRSYGIQIIGTKK